MCQRTYAINTNKGPIEVTKGTYLTFKKRQQQTANACQTIKKKVLDVPKKGKNIMKIQAQIKSIARRLSVDSSLKTSPRME